MGRLWPLVESSRKRRATPPYVILNASQLLWYMGGGGTGKSVLSAELLGRVFDRTAAWHFCRCVAAPYPIVILSL